MINSADIILAVTTSSRAQAARFEYLQFFSFMSMLLTLLCFIHRGQRRPWSVAFAVFVTTTAILGAMQGAWPCAAIVLVCAYSVAFRSTKLQQSEHLPSMRSPQSRRAQLFRASYREN